MATPALKVYDSAGKYIAALRFAEDAAAVLAINPGATLRFDHGVTVWREGGEGFSAADSYDRTAEIVWLRVDAVRTAAWHARDRRLRRGELQRAADSVSSHGLEDL